MARFSADQPRDRAGERDLRAHRDTSDVSDVGTVNVRVSGSSAHWANRPSDDFRYTPVDATDWWPRISEIRSTGVPSSIRRVASVCLSECIPSTTLLTQPHARGAGVLDQDLVQMVLVGERADRRGMPQKHLRAIAAWAAVADVVDDRPADVLEQRQHDPPAGLRLHHRELIARPVQISELAAV